MHAAALRGVPRRPRNATENLLLKTHSYGRPLKSSARWVRVLTNFAGDVVQAGCVLDLSLLLSLPKTLSVYHWHRRRQPHIRHAPSFSHNPLATQAGVTLDVDAIFDPASAIATTATKTTSSFTTSLVTLGTMPRSTPTQRNVSC